jgi:hypothetical protein
MPLGKGKLTGEIYTARYNEMAKAMRAVDPTIKIGSCPFVEEALRDCGDNVDFVSLHTYPGSTTLSDAQMFADISKSVEREMGPVKQWIKKYQPKREKEIEIAYSEWNLAGGMDNGRLFSGLWSSIFLGEIAKNGAHMAHQWDLFADLVYDLGGGKGFVRKAEFYALALWNNYMGDRLIPATVSDPAIYSYASRSDNSLSVMLVNTDKDREAKVNLKLSGFTPAGTGEVARVTSREYHYNAAVKRMFWSTGPRIEPLKTGSNFSVTLAPFSITYVRVPDRAKPALSPMAQKALTPKKAVPGTPELRFVVPEETYAGDQVYGEVLAMNSGSEEPYPGTLAPATLSANGEAGFDRQQVRLAEAVGYFHMKPTVPGELTITVQSGNTKATHRILVKPSVPRPVVFWDFTNPLVTDKDTFSSSYTLKEDLTQRANRAVARIDLPADGARPDVDDKDRMLLAVGKLPEDAKLNKANIRGVIVDMRTSEDFASDDPQARIVVVMQSPANWWMQLGEIPLKDATAWKSHQIDVTNEEYIKAMPSAMNVFFVLRTSKPVKGSVYFDRIGFMVR